MTSTIGIPIKLLNEAQVCQLYLFQPQPRHELELSLLSLYTLFLCWCDMQGHVVTLEITSGQVYRGKLLEGVLP